MVVLLIVAAVIGFVVLRSRNRQAQAQAQADAEALNSVKAVAEEDVTGSARSGPARHRHLGHGPRRGRAPGLPPRARRLRRGQGCPRPVTKPEDIRDVTAILEDGRYAIACVRARLAGEPLPARRPPCFFNPQHGPSTDDVEWAPPGGDPRPVPACAADAERVLAGAEPDVRKVAVGAGRRPYWEAGRLRPLCAGLLLGLRRVRPAPGRPPRRRAVRRLRRLGRRRVRRPGRRRRRRR